MAKASYTTAANCLAGCGGGSSSYCYGAVTCYYGSGTSSATIGTQLTGKNAFCSASSTVMFATTTTSTTGNTGTGIYCWCPSTCTSTMNVDYLADNPVSGSPTYVGTRNDAGGRGHWSGRDGGRGAECGSREWRGAGSAGGRRAGRRGAEWG